MITRIPISPYPVPAIASIGHVLPLEEKQLAKSNPTHFGPVLILKPKTLFMSLPGRGLDGVSSIHPLARVRKTPPLGMIPPCVSVVESIALFGLAASALPQILRHHFRALVVFGPLCSFGDVSCRPGHLVR